MNPRPRRVNQAEIARALGLSQSTVSIGLKGDTRVTRKTREAIRKKAIELGYVPDPHLVALSHYRSKSKVEKIVAAMAWVTNHPTADGWKSKMCLDYWKGASERAQQLGYQINEFWLGDPKISPERLKGILQARGIRGLIFAPQAQYHTRIDFDLSGFASVAFGYSLQSPSLPIVTNYQHQAARLAYRRLQALGYQRIGLLLSDAVDRRVDRNFSGGYHTMNPSGLMEDFIQPHLFDSFREDEFDKWYQQWRPDAVLVTGNSSATLREWMHKQGMSPGRDLAFAEMNLNSTDGVIAGVDQQPKVIGMAAVDLLDSQLRRFEYGVPAQPMRVLVEGIWRDGKSAPPKER